LQGQQEAACACPANAATGVLFTATNAVKFSSAAAILTFMGPNSVSKAETQLP